MKQKFQDSQEKWKMQLERRVGKDLYGEYNLHLLGCVIENAFLSALPR